MEKFQTSIFERSKEKSRKRLIYNIAIFGAIAAIWMFCLVGFPFTNVRLGLVTAIGLSVTLVGIKMYDDKYMGITAYGDRSANLVIAEQYLEIRDIRISYTELTNLVIYVEEYLGMPKEFFGTHHGGNNKIEFSHKGKSVSINYVIKNKEDYKRVSLLVDGIEKNPELKKYLRKL
ncbi:hypothetical protein WSM22_44960 [Cytophagales bacterium WSM2-2]|nr:hypothetical protein WSM22_44960 [Cytophagales bacterium WSM2-2]